MTKDNAVNITVVGTGYVGLVTGACFAEMGNTVTCVDIDGENIAQLQDNIVPLYEPGLDNVVKENSQAGRLTFSEEIPRALGSCDVCFIATGLPQEIGGGEELPAIMNVADTIAQHICGYTVIVIKSTVPVGTADKVTARIQQILDEMGSDTEFDVVSNPEFMKEGSAVDDFMSPDRIVVGVNCDRAKAIMGDIYQSFSRNRDKLLFMGVRDAEMTKYAATAMLATKISFMNEISNLAEHLNVDIENVRKGIGSDNRIGYSFIYPGCGYGGSCFPKDVRALIAASEEFDFEPKLLRAVEDRNEDQKQRLFEKLQSRFGDDMSGRVVGVWGLSFKPNTQDLAESSSVALIERLIDAGAQVKAYDPVAMDAAKRYFPARYFDENHLQLTQHQYDALLDADAMVLVTEWKPFRQPDFIAIKKLLKHPIIIDGRNQYDPKSLKDQGFDYSGIGRTFG